MSTFNPAKQPAEIEEQKQVDTELETVAVTTTQVDQQTKPAESVFELALRAKAERLANPIVRVTKAPASIKPTSKIKGWFRTHSSAPLGPIDVFHPKDEAGFSDEPIFVFPNVADELRASGSQFENAVREMFGYLVSTTGGAMYLVLVPVADPATGRHHSAVAQKVEAFEAAKFEWKRLEWNKNERQYDDLTAVAMTTEPKWPEDVSPPSILTRAFGERNVIKSVNDPLIVKFRGEA